MSNNNNTDGKAKAAKTIAIIAFVLVVLALMSAIVSDIAIFSQQIFGFFVACIGSAAVLIIGFILFVFSCIFVFGLYLLEEHGFWPITWSSDVFHQVLEDYSIAKEQVIALISIRVMLIIACVTVFILSIISLALSKSAKKNGYTNRQGLTKAFSIISLILSVFGIFAAITVLTITSTL